MTATTPVTSTSPAIDAAGGLREGYAEVGDVRLHYVEAGDGPLVLLLHGFPQFWYAWRHQIPALATRFRVVAPDLRGYGDTDKPPRVPYGAPSTCSRCDVHRETG